MNLDRAAESMLAGAALLAFVGSLALFNAVSAVLAHVSWVVATIGGAGLTGLGAVGASRAFHVSLSERSDGDRWSPLDEPAALSPR